MSLVSNKKRRLNMKKPPILSQADNQGIMGRFEHVPIHKLKPHEEILESRLPEIMNAIQEGKLLNGTILVGLPHHIILDGHHRVASLKKLGATRIPAFVLRYLDNPHIQVGTWFPTVQWSFSWDWALEELQAKLDFKPIEIKLNRYRFEQDLQDHPGIKNHFVFIPWQSINLPSVQGYVIPTSQKSVLEALRKMGGQIDFLPTIDHAIDAVTERKTFFLARRTPTKSDVVNKALTGDLFAPKTTRHVLLHDIPKRNFNFHHFIGKSYRQRNKLERKELRLRHDV